VSLRAPTTYPLHEDHLCTIGRLVHRRRGVLARARAARARARERMDVHVRVAVMAEEDRVLNHFEISRAAGDADGRMEVYIESVAHELVAALPEDEWVLRRHLEVL
jgi:hypothetical protein